MSRGPKVPPVTLAQVEAFAAMIRPQPRTGRTTENDQFLALLYRLVRALEHRMCEDAEMLSQAKALAGRFAEAVNVAIAVQATRYDADPHRAASGAECARAMEISPQSVQDRKALGLASILKRLGVAEANARAVRLDDRRMSKAEAAVALAEAQRKALRGAEVARERAAREAAAQVAVVQLDRYRARHRAA